MTGSVGPTGPSSGGPAGPSSAGPGILYVLATPLGNLEDLSPRAARVLGTAALVVVEDTRVTRKLLAHLGLEKRMFSYYREREVERAPEVLEVLRSGSDVALCTDAGSPGVSDPGAVLVAAAHAAGIRVVPVPGPSAVAAAISVSGFEGSGFRFVGFLPRKGPERSAALGEIALERVPTVLFEAPGRVGRTLNDLLEVCGSTREAVVGRELTKLHEEVLRGSLGVLAERFAGEVRGEVTIVVGSAAPRQRAEVTDEVIRAALEARPEAESTRERVDAVADALEVPRRRVYQLAVRPRD